MAVLDAPAFARVVRIAEGAAGLSIPESKRTMVQSRLAKRLKATGLSGFDLYLDHVEGPDGEAERAMMVSALTTNVSHFFREGHHFETLRESVLPALVARARNGGRVRIWSAGCSTGQEPYTIAMTLLETEPRIGAMNVRILATDIDQNVLAVARAGHYDERQLEPVPESRKSRHFMKASVASGGSFSVASAVRDLVSFRPLNLMARWPMQGTFDVIFCRNVVIYFSESTQASLWPRFHDALVPDGWLFLGHSERIHDPAAHGFEAAGVTTYRRRTDAAPKTIQ